MTDVLANHGKDLAPTWMGMLATEIADLEGAPHWLITVLAVLTIIYTIIKIGVIGLEFRKKWRERDETRKWEKRYGIDRKP